jgi:putative addiction module component (TIGR02574 family)
VSIYEINQLNVKEKIILMKNIWESLEVESNLIESPSWHKEILDERIKKMKDNKVRYVSLEELKNR